MKNSLILLVLVSLFISCNFNRQNDKTSKLAKGDVVETTWGTCTFSDMEEGACLLLEVVRWPDSSVLVVKDLSARIEDIYLKSNPKRHLAWRFYKGDLQIHIASLDKEVKDTLIVKTRGKVSLPKISHSSV